MQRPNPKLKSDILANSQEFVSFELIRKQAELRVRDELASRCRHAWSNGATHHVCLPVTRNTIIHKMK